MNNLPNITYFLCINVASLKKVFEGKDITFVINDQITQLQAPFKHTNVTVNNTSNQINLLLFKYSAKTHLVTQSS